MELFDALDENGEKKGYTIPRGSKIEDGDYMGIVNVLVCAEGNQFLITKRHPLKTAPNKWEITGGGILAGESPLLAAKRELAEETGIVLEESQFHKLGQEVSGPFYAYLYMVILAKKPKIKLQPTETVDYKWLSKKVFFLALKKDDFIPYLGKRLEKYQDKIEEVVKTKVK